MPFDTSIKKVLVIGSGPIVIGQAAEFDYAGAQACRVLKAAGVNVVLVNSNPATIMTDNALADEIYLEPINATTVKRIIEKEKPDSLLATLGGQLGLTIAMQLSKEGFLEKSGVRLLGTDATAIDKAEDRELFRDTMLKIGQPCIPSGIALTVDKARQIADEIGYPVIIRPAFTLGGAGGGVANTVSELETIAANGLLLSPITQILVEKYIFGWKEIEFETMRDAKGNAVAVCSMENFDPVGVHTGDSIVIAPAVTLSTEEYTMLHDAALDIVNELDIRGGCNCQFALNPESMEYAVIEVNPRVSRSSALASKASGYPIAKVTTKIALGYTLDEISNDITGSTSACFEPTLDYMVVKFPKWPFDKFVTASRKLGTQMKATGEVMAIAQSFEEALMKAVRGAEIGLDTLNMESLKQVSDIRQKLHDMDDIRLFTIFEAIRRKISIDEIYQITKIDRWFLNCIKNLADFEKEIENKPISESQYIKAKKLGYPDIALERISGQKLMYHRKAVYKMVDTCAAKVDAVTPYFYSSYDDECESRAIGRGKKQRIIVLGSGPIRIGQGIEFDYSSVHCVWTLKELGYEVIIINNNPETVSTDFDTADRLYFEPLTAEDVQNVIDVENPVGVVVAFGGQTAIKLTKYLSEKNIKILGTSAKSIDIAEDRQQFDQLLEKFDIRRPKGKGVMTKAEAINAAQQLGYPVLLRPSYVIGGQNMIIAYDSKSVEQYMDIILSTGIENPVLVDKYLMGTELEVDVISDGKDILIPGIMEHVERAGVHSGDSIAVYPPVSISDILLDKIVKSSEKIALSLKTKGLVNIQFLIYEGELYVIEVNPRASRTIPYISKVTGVPMVDIAAKMMVGYNLKDMGFGTGLYKTPPYVAVKVPVFSFEKLVGANAALSPEMKSTGEVLGLGKTVEEAMFKGFVSAGFKLGRTKNGRGVLISVKDSDKFEIVKLAKKFDDIGFNIYATQGTATEIKRLGCKVTVVPKGEGILNLLESGCIDYIVNTCDFNKHSVDDFIAMNRRAIQLSLPCITSLDTANMLADIEACRFNQYNTELIDINHLRTSRQKLQFVKMEGTGDDYIFINNMDQSITCPESLSITFTDRHYSIGGDGIVLIEKSEIADAKMRIFNQDGSEGEIAGNCLRCVAKYLYDNKITDKTDMAIETASGVRRVRVYLYNGLVRSVTADMGKAELKASKIPVLLEDDKIIDKKVDIGGRNYNITCVSVGNPHCVIFSKRVDDVDLENVGPQIENAEIFPLRVNTEFIRVIDRRTIKMRVWERGNGETYACGTGACAAVIAAVENGYCDKDTDVTVKVRGGDLLVKYTDNGVFLTGDAKTVYNGVIEY